MQAPGWAQIHRDLRVEVLREGLVVDVRENRGGHTSQLVVEKLARRIVGWDLPRGMRAESYPRDAPGDPSSPSPTSSPAPTATSSTRRSRRSASAPSSAPAPGAGSSASTAATGWSTARSSPSPSTPSGWRDTAGTSRTTASTRTSRSSSAPRTTRPAATSSSTRRCGWRWRRWSRPRRRHRRGCRDRARWGCLRGPEGTGGGRRPAAGSVACLGSGDRRAEEGVWQGNPRTTVCSARSSRAPSRRRSCGDGDDRRVP